jgi:alkylation response protein AidB-like acyl-CoA dehydrogenase
VFLVDASTDRSKGLPASPRCASRTGSRIRRSVFAIARLVVYRPGWLLDRGKSSPLGAALAELYLSECYLQSSLDALQVHGGYGYMTEYELEREVRGAVGTRIHSGTSDLQRNIIAGFAGV